MDSVTKQTMDRLDTLRKSISPKMSQMSNMKLRRSVTVCRINSSQSISLITLENGETFMPSGDFERDFCELCRRYGISSLKVVQRPHRPSNQSSGRISHTDTTKAGAGSAKESKEDKQKSVPSQESPKAGNDQEQLPLTYTTKEKFDYFKPKVEIETEDEGIKVHIKDIYIRGWKVDKKITDILDITLRRQERLTTLDLWNTGLTDETLEYLAKAISSNNLLKNLRLDGNCYILHQRYGVFLKEDSPIQNLSLKNCYINDIGAKNIGESLVVNKNLATLNICFNKVTCDGAAHIAKGLRMNRTLLSLNLGSNLIGDRGAIKIAETLSKFPLTHDEVVYRRTLLSKKSAGEAASLILASPTIIRPTSSVRSGASAHFNKDSKSSKDKWMKKNKDSLLAKGTKDSRKASQIDVSWRSTLKFPKKSATYKPDRPRPLRESEQESPDFFDFHHPLLGTIETINGEIWLPGNRALINLNLARNKIGEDGIKSLYSAVQQQIAITNQTGKTAGVGLLRLSVQGNNVLSGHPVFIQLSELMLTRDPFYKPSAATLSGESVKDERTD